jgi:adenosylcobinamide-phosphate synthase
MPLHGTEAALTLLLAAAIDHLLGEPAPRFHPVVWMGKALNALGAPWPRDSPRGAFLKGAAAWWLLAATTVAAVLLLQALIRTIEFESWPRASLLLRALLTGLILKPCLAWRMLRQEVVEVENALKTDLDLGRRRLSRIVGRDTAELSPTVVRESALESLSENLNDSWVAPLFWFVIAGVPGAMFYRFANTADAMWGTRGRFEWAGKWSARADDVLSFIPARLTAGLLALTSLRSPAGLKRIASVTASPNGGWPMGMMALALDVRLSRPGHYVLHETGRSVTDLDVHRGLHVAARVAWSGLVIAVVLIGV